LQIAEGYQKVLTDKGLSAEYISLQIKSLQNAWAFWFDTYNEEFETVYKTGEQKFFDLFEKFRQQMFARLEDSQDMLVIEPGELMRLAKHHMQAKNYKDAIRCYEKVIERNADFSGFAYYYLAQAIINTGSNPESKQRARMLLKKSIPLLKLRYLVSLLLIK